MNTDSRIASQRFEQFATTRKFSMRIASSLEKEDCVVQSMPDVSPTKWHLAHTTWFFEEFVLTPSLSGYKRFHPQYAFLFNSYYNAVGNRHARAQRGVLSRPTVEEIFEYRAYVDEHLERVIHQRLSEEMDRVIEIGIHHEQQHQELMLTDIKHVFSQNPLHPAFRVDLNEVNESHPTPASWSAFHGKIVEIGHQGNAFHYDNEAPRHEVLIQDFELSNRLVTNQEYHEFITDGGYQRPEFWLSEGWDTVQQNCWSAPLYWEQIDSDWQEFTLGGLRPLHPHRPVSHVSFFEADAFARWSGNRLPTEAEWETASSGVDVTSGIFVEDDYLHPIPFVPTSPQQAPGQLFGNLWEWTSSPYVAYPGYKPSAGALGEYNGKFMSSQWVLRGGSCVTSRLHVRATYRNFFHPDKRWQFSGIRLVR